MRTKIIATLGPASMKYDVMKGMVEHGVRIFRLNFSHADAASFVPVVQDIRKLEQEMGIRLTVMGDLCGPKIRIGEVPGSPLQINKGQGVLLGLPKHAERAEEDRVFISLDVPELMEGLKAGDAVFLADGMLRFTVNRVLIPDQLFEMVARTEGLLTSHKGIAFPDKIHPLPALTEKDEKDLREGLDIGIDAVALSFVQGAEDVERLRRLIQEHGRIVPVVAKLERKAAVEHIDEIVAAADCVMVARGDLGVECSLAKLPVMQKRIIRACRHQQKAVIVATQMMLSMVKSPVPTRAEATDVGNAVMDGADCVMLSEETAIGNYPVETCAFIQGIAQSCEDYYLERLGGPYVPSPEKNIVKYLAYSACLVAEHADSAALVCHSTSGATARMLSSRRPSLPIFALSPDEGVLRGMNFFWGVRPRLADVSLVSHLERAVAFIRGEASIEQRQSVVITSGQPMPPGQPETKTNGIKLFYK
ncbi:pyruvate kinase [Desulfobaculum bizertense]|uniref:Pyruvate kinase n=1 Tax=Desulfobaculum bizertense DSM 18034 TaxID=1121442 RepID=A0A1T4VIF9_9BACT|nr:pyruvate kinase [Desulfobaculum bizertense]SKA64750.1 pyruvate kinase [Desulfobaculum bizertense DSM 18034]